MNIKEYGLIQVVHDIEDNPPTEINTMNAKEIVLALQADHSKVGDDSPVTFNGRLVEGVTLEQPNDGGQQVLHIRLSKTVAWDGDPEEGEGYN